MLIDNAYYGHAAALAEYCGLRSAPPIWGYLQHGVATSAPFEGYRLSRRLPKLTWGEPAARLCREQHRDHVVAMGAPMLYLDRLRAQRPSTTGATEPTGTIVYPFHGWEREQVFGSHDRFAGEIGERERGPVTVCLYWNEARDRSIVDAYARDGFRVICSGSRNFTGFLQAQRTEMLRHRRFVTNRVGSGLFYASVPGLQVDVYGEVFALGADEVPGTLATLWSQRWPSLVAGSIDQDGLREAARSELGADRLLEPPELARLLGWSRSRRSIAPLVRLAVSTRRGALHLDDASAEPMPSSLLAPGSSEDS